jgi:hypothetical protein
LRNRVIGNDEINQLPEDSSIIFLDDFIGTGTQAIEYIHPLIYSMDDTIKPFLLSIYSTETGITRIQRLKTKFTVLSARILTEADYFLLSDSCHKLTNKQKEYVYKMNHLPAYLKKVLI